MGERALALTRPADSTSDEVLVWDLETKATINRLNEHPGRVKTAFFCNGGVVVTLGEDNRLRAWDPAKTLLCLSTFTAGFNMVEPNLRCVSTQKTQLGVIFTIGRATTISMPALAKERARMTGISIFGNLGSPNMKEISAAKSKLKTATPPATPVKKWKPEPLPEVRLKSVKKQWEETPPATPSDSAPPGAAGASSTLKKKKTEAEEKEESTAAAASTLKKKKNKTGDADASADADNNEAATEGGDSNVVSQQPNSSDTAAARRKSSKVTAPATEGMPPAKEPCCVIL